MPVSIFALIAVLVGMLNDSCPFLAAHERDGFGFAWWLLIWCDYREVLTSPALFIDRTFLCRDSVQFTAKGIGGWLLAHGAIPTVVMPRNPKGKMEHFQFLNSCICDSVLRTRVLI